VRVRTDSTKATPAAARRRCPTGSAAHGCVSVFFAYTTREPARGRAPLPRSGEVLQQRERILAQGGGLLDQDSNPKHRAGPLEQLEADPVAHHGHDVEKGWRETLALRMRGPNKPLGDVVEGLPRPTIDIVAFPGDQKLDPPRFSAPRYDLLDVLAVWQQRPFSGTCNGFGLDSVGYRFFSYRLFPEVHQISPCLPCSSAPAQRPPRCLDLL